MFMPWRPLLKLCANGAFFMHAHWCCAGDCHGGWQNMQRLGGCGWHGERIPKRSEMSSALRELGMHA